MLPPGVAMEHSGRVVAPDQGCGTGGTPIFTTEIRPLARVALYVTLAHGPEIVYWCSVEAIPLRRRTLRNKKYHMGGQPLPWVALSSWKKEAPKVTPLPAALVLWAFPSIVKLLSYRPCRHANCARHNNTTVPPYDTFLATRDNLLLPSMILRENYS